MAKSNRACYLCSKKYEYCPNCGRHDPIYKATFCSENCRDIFKSLSQYGCNLISAEDCKELLECCDLQPELYKESTRNNIAKILGTQIEKVIEEIIPEVEQEAAEVIDEVHEVIEEIIHEDIVEEYKPRKHKNEVVLENNE